MLVGMIVAYPGDATAVEASDPMWKLCDGRSLIVREHLPLFEVISWTYGRGEDVAGRTTFALPDFRGYFLRGLDSSGTKDLGAQDRTDHRGQPIGARIGSLQTDATRMPRIPFSAAEAGSHRHEFPRGVTWSGTHPGRSAFILDAHRDFVPGEHMDVAGQHAHTLVGGDPETRPANVAVNWMIRCGP